MKMTFKDWRTQLEEYFAASGDAELLDKSQKPTGETNYLPVASSPVVWETPNFVCGVCKLKL